MAALAIAIGSGIGSSILGYMGQQSSNRKEKKAIEQKYEYDVEAREMNIEKMKADYDFLVESILSQERNLDRQNAYKDQLALDTYNRELQIAQIERETNARAFAKSEQIYGQTLGLNIVERQYAQDAAYQQRKEIQQAAAFDNQQSIIDALQAQVLLQLGVNPVVLQPRFNRLRQWHSVETKLYWLPLS